MFPALPSALEAPLRRLAANAGQDGSVVLETVRNSAAVLGFACDATWQLLAFVAEPAYATKWAVARHDYWPDLAIAVIRESVRLLGEERMTQFGPVLSALERSPLALESPMGP